MTPDFDLLLAGDLHVAVGASRALDRRERVGAEGIDHALIVLAHIRGKLGFDSRHAGERRLEFITEPGHALLVFELECRQIGFRGGGGLLLLRQLGGALVDFAKRG